jgi:parallel beta-helix repeat protein
MYNVTAYGDIQDLCGLSENLTCPNYMENAMFGINCYGCNNAIIDNLETLNMGYHGVYLRNANNNIIRNSEILNSYWASIQIRESSNSQIYNNVFNGSYLVGYEGSPGTGILTNSIFFRSSIFSLNDWNNSVNGNTYFENGSGYSETCINANNDSICDYPLYFNESGDIRNVDYKPFALNDIEEPVTTTTTTIITTTTTEEETTTTLLTTTTEEETTTTLLTTTTVNLEQNINQTKGLIGYIFDFLDTVISRLPSILFGLFVIAMIMLFLKFGKGISSKILGLLNGIVKR